MKKGVATEKICAIKSNEKDALQMFQYDLLNYLN